MLLNFTIQNQNSRYHNIGLPPSGHAFLSVFSHRFYFYRLFLITNQSFVNNSPKMTSIPTVNNGCFNIKLRTLAITLGYYGIIAQVLTFIINYLQLHYFEYFLQQIATKIMWYDKGSADYSVYIYHLNQHSMELKLALVLSAVTSSVEFVSSVFLIRGVCTKRADLVRVFVMLLFPSMVVTFIAGSIFAVAISAKEQLRIVLVIGHFIGIAVICKLCVCYVFLCNIPTDFKVYMWFCMHTLYERIRKGESID